MFLFARTHLLTWACPCDRGTWSTSSPAATTAISAFGTYAPAAATGRTSHPAGQPPVAVARLRPWPPPRRSASWTAAPPGSAITGAPVRCTATAHPESAAEARRAIPAAARPPVRTHVRTRMKAACVSVRMEAPGSSWVETPPPAAASALMCPVIKQCGWVVCMVNHCWRTGIHMRWRLTVVYWPQRPAWLLAHGPLGVLPWGLGLLLGHPHGRRQLPPRPRRPPPRLSPPRLPQRHRGYQ